jgi:hypothetical protein
MRRKTLLAGLISLALLSGRLFAQDYMIFNVLCDTCLSWRKGRVKLMSAPHCVQGKMRKDETVLNSK